MHKLPCVPFYLTMNTSDKEQTTGFEAFHFVLVFCEELLVLLHHPFVPTLTLCKVIITIQRYICVHTPKLVFITNLH